MASLETVRGAARKKDKQQGFATMASLLGQMDDKQLGVAGDAAAPRPLSRAQAYAQYYHAMLATAAEDRETGTGQLEGSAGSHNPKLVPAHLLRTRLLLDQGDPPCGAGRAGQSGGRPAARSQPADEITPGCWLTPASWTRLAASSPSCSIRIPRIPIRSMRSGCWRAETRQFDLAEAYFLDLIKRKTRLAEAYFELGRIEEQRGDYAKANEWYERVTGRRALSVAQMRMGVVLAKAGDTAAVWPAFRHAAPQGIRKTAFPCIWPKPKRCGKPNAIRKPLTRWIGRWRLHPDDKDLLYALGRWSPRSSTGWTFWSGIYAPFSLRTPKTARRSMRSATPWPTAPTAIRKRWVIIEQALVAAARRCRRAGQHGLGAIPAGPQRQGAGISAPRLSSESRRRNRRASQRSAVGQRSA
jgi:tetratricopeptide (TPR) repeat protein